MIWWGHLRICKHQWSFRLCWKREALQLPPWNQRENDGWLVVWNMCYFPYIGNNHPNWLLYFSEGVKPPTRYRSNPWKSIKLPTVTVVPRWFIHVQNVFITTNQMISQVLVRLLAVNLSMSWDTSQSYSSCSQQQLILILYELTYANIIWDMEYIMW